MPEGESGGFVDFDEADAGGGAHAGELRGVDAGREIEQERGVCRAGGELAHAGGAHGCGERGGAGPVVVGGDVAVWFGELDEPHTEGQLRVLALDPELVWFIYTDEPWRPGHEA